MMGNYHVRFGKGGHVGKRHGTLVHGSVKDIVKYIIPHFDKYPLVTQKLKDFMLFKEIILLMEKGEHNILPGLKKVFSLKVNLNKGLPTVVKEEFPDILPTVLPEFKLPLSFNPN